MRLLPFLIGVCLFVSMSHIQAKDSTPLVGFQVDLSLQTLQDRAFEAQMPYLVYLHDDSKRQAKRMLKCTWSEENVQQLLQRSFLGGAYHPLHAGEHLDLIRHFEVYEYPVLLIFSPEGTLMGKSEGFVSAETMVGILTKHLSLLEQQKDLMAYALGSARGQEPDAVEVSASPFSLTPPLLVGNITRFSAPDATRSESASPVPVAHITDLFNAVEPSVEVVGEQMNSRGLDENAVPEPAPVPALSVATPGLLADVPGLEAFGLSQWTSRQGETSTEAFGLLVGQYLVFEEAKAAVEKFERLWRDRIFVYGEDVKGTLVYRVVLGEYEDENTAKAFSQAIYRMERINPSIIPLHSLTAGLR